MQKVVYTSPFIIRKSKKIEKIKQEKIVLNVKPDVDKFYSRLLIWKSGSRIAPPVFYVLIGERERLKELKICLCPKIQNSVDPNIEANQTYSMTVSQK